jgi:hypothetical protein
MLLAGVGERPGYERRYRDSMYSSTHSLELRQVPSEAFDAFRRPRTAATRSASADSRSVASDGRGTNLAGPAIAGTTNL